MLHTETVNEETMDMIRRLMKDPEFKDFFLVGGTALSLQIGHRISVDIDLFTGDRFDKLALKEHLLKNYDPHYIEIKSNGLGCFVDKENMDVWYYPAPLVKPLEVVEGIRMLSIDDIAAMKIISIATGSERIKDYADIYSILENKSFNELIEIYNKKYPEYDSLADSMKIADHSEIKFNTKVTMMNQAVGWEQISARLKEAIVLRNKVYNQVSQKDVQKKSSRLRKGRRL